MKNLNEFLSAAEVELGTGRETTRAATVGLLGHIRKHVTGEDFGKLLGSMPGAEKLVETERRAPAGSGGLLGALGSKLAGDSKGALGSALGLVGLLKQTGLSPMQTTKFASMFVGFAEQRAGADFIGKILEKIPELKKIAR